jgi:transcriptional regulator with XRE-family HTH domain
MKKREVLIKIGLKIRQLRSESGLSQQDLAAACNFEKSNMSRVEAGRSNLTIGTLLKICAELNVELKDIVDVE